MKTVKIMRLPNCDICNDNTAAYDAPTRSGAWGYMCAKCYKDQGSPQTGTKLQVRDVTGDNGKNVTKEAVMVNDLEEALTECVIELECPSCGEIRRMEIDFDGKFVCDGCEQSLRFRNTIC